MFLFLEDLYLGLNIGNVAAAAFYDFCKVFNCYGFNGVDLQWFRSFISG